MKKLLSPVHSWWVSRPWDELLSVRRGFLVGALGGFFIAGSTLWGVASLPYLTGRHIDTNTLVPASQVPIARGMVPPQLAWFFIQYPYVSERAQIRTKNFHTYVISDPSRKRDYVV